MTSEWCSFSTSPLLLSYVLQVKDTLSRGIRWPLMPWASQQYLELCDALTRSPLTTVTGPSPFEDFWVSSAFLLCHAADDVSMGAGFFTIQQGPAKISL